MFYANVTDYAREWLNISDEMRWKTSTAPQVSCKTAVILLKFGHLKLLLVLF